MSAWQKLGLLYAPAGGARHPKLVSHAANPLPVHLEGDVYRVFYSGRDAQKRSSVGAVDIDLGKLRVVQDHAEPFFLHGPAGSFYADGVSIGNVYAAGGRRFMPFMGWQVAGQPHWRGEVGLLELTGDFRLKLADPRPLLARDDEDPVSLSYPWVQPSEDGFRMWYGSTVTWDAGNGEMLHVLKAARSADGRVWRREGQAVPSPVGVAQAFSRPTVARGQEGGWEMWFSYRTGRGETYRIGKAVSRDGHRWELALDEAGISVSAEGWDSQMIEYPFVWSHQGRQFMLYNGNGYGESGFGIAVRARP